MLVVDDVDVDVTLVDVVDLDVDELDDDDELDDAEVEVELDDDEVELDVDGASEEDELLDDVDVVVLVVRIVDGGSAVLEVLVGIGADELVLDEGAGVSVVEVTLPPIVVDVLVDVDTSCAGRVVLDVVEARGRLVDVVVVLVARA